MTDPGTLINELPDCLEKVAKFMCDGYEDGMTGAQIKAARVAIHSFICYVAAF